MMMAELYLYLYSSRFSYRSPPQGSQESMKVLVAALKKDNFILKRLTDCYDGLAGYQS